MLAEVAARSVATRCGSSRSPTSTTMAIVPSSSGTPAIVNSKNPNSSEPASVAASENRTLTGEPVNASIDPACA